MKKNQDVTQRCPNCGKDVKGTLQTSVIDILAMTTVCVDPCPAPTKILAVAAKEAMNTNHR